MVMTDTKQENNVSEIAEEIGMSYERFLGRCVMKGLSPDTAKALWIKEERARGFFKTTQKAVSEILKRPVEDIFGA